DMDILMPQLGETVAEGKITTWYKSVGDKVASGDALFEIETDKTSMEVPTTEPGVLTEIHVGAWGRRGSANAWRTRRLRSGQPGALAGAALRAGDVAERHQGHPRGPQAGGRVRCRSGRPQRFRTARPHRRTRRSGGGAGRRRELGGGPQDGHTARWGIGNPLAVLRKDQSAVRRCILRGGAARWHATHHRASPDRGQAEHSELLFEHGRVHGQAKISINDFIIKAVALALQRVPEANAVWAEESLLRFRQSDVAVAVAVE